MKLLRVRSLPERLGISRQAIYQLVAKDLLPSPFQIGSGGAAVVPEHELDRVVAARSAGATDDQVREIVRDIYAQRVASAAEVLR